MNRDRFPALREGWARLDGPAGSQVVDSAIEAMADWMRSGSQANHGGQFKQAHETDELVASTRAACATLLGGEPSGVVFGPSFTALTMRFAATVVRELSAGDEIVCTRLDHDSNVRPWVIAAERAGATVRWAEPDRETLALPAAAIEAALSDRTRWVAVTAASNATGTVPELEAIIAAAHRVGARISLDAVAAAPHRALDLPALGADTLACSAYKWYGPHVGMLCGAPELLAELHPDKLNPSPDEVPDRFELGTLPFESLAGVTAAAEYMLEVGFDAIRSHEERLLAIASEGLAAIDGVTLYGDPPDRVPTLMFNVSGYTSTEVAAALAEREIAVWDGNYYAWELERFLGLDPHGAVRAGFVHYNDAEDARRLVEAVGEVAEGARTQVAAASEETPA
jgi:cysteine desulfurase family protein (TIGR01976 family)